MLPFWFPLIVCINRARVGRWGPHQINLLRLRERGLKGPGIKAFKKAF